MIDTLLALQLGSALGVGLGVSALLYAVATSGRARPENEVAVRQLIETAPYHRLDNILSQDR